jgi:hypothetical protein
MLDERPRMQVALLTEFAATRKEPLSVLLERIHAAFLASGLGEPSILFAFSDAPVPGAFSTIDRLLKKYPDFARFTGERSGIPNVPPVRQVSNRAGSPAAGEPVPFATLLAVAAGVPKSLPFHGISIHFHSPAFGVQFPLGHLAPIDPGVMVTDSWWVNGRDRGVRALTSVDADPAGTQLPPLPERVAAVLAACGKIKSTVQVPLAAGAAPTAPPQFARLSPEVAQAVSAVITDYKARLAEVVERASPPHDLPPALEALQTISPAETTGPKKPVLVRAFKPMGYDCQAERGTFTLRRRTPGNLTVAISLDVGTWSKSLHGSFAVKGIGFSARLRLPVSRRALEGMQYRIGDAAHWQKLVDNMAAIVAELDRTFVPAIEAAAGPAPEWFKPEA